jgi:hypothetical protein
MLAFEPVTMSVGMWLLSKPQLIVRPKRLMVFARREVIKSALIEEMSEPMCMAVNVFPSFAVVVLCGQRLVK